MSMELLFRYEIDGEPASKANSRRIVMRGKKLASIKSAKALDYSDAFRAQLPPDPVPYIGDVKIEIDVWYASRRPDLDISLILDLLQGHAYANDRQVKEQHSRWHLDPDRPRCVILISALPGDDQASRGRRRKGVAKGKA
jgi:Holliday junction resolvase RusA-like endonuclease